MMNCRVQEESVISERDFSNFGHDVGWQVILLSDKCLYSERKKFGGCAFGCRIRSCNKQIMDCYSRSVSSKREATFISLREAEMAVKRKGFIVSLWTQNKNFLQKLLKDDCIYWRLEPVFEDKRVLRILVMYLNM